MNRQELAKYGEDKAADFIENKGYKIVIRNFKCKIGEIDIIALDSDTLVFVEVKTRYETDQTKPEDSITKRKLWLIEKTGEFYRQSHEELPELLRIDAVLIELAMDDRVKRLELIKNAQL